MKAFYIKRHVTARNVFKHGPQAACSGHTKHNTSRKTTMANIKALLKLLIICPIIVMTSLRLYKNCERCDIPAEVIKTQPKPYWPWLPGYKSDQKGYVWPLYFTG
ncbi:hypothetical protein SFRURICE_003034 [Spodoptera frugiperda]|nr:hypothetical protein SFRURICE_003034 [Spodoptera frugiperda]